MFKLTTFTTTVYLTDLNLLSLLWVTTITALDRNSWPRFYMYIDASKHLRINLNIMLPISHENRPKDLWKITLVAYIKYTHNILLSISYKPRIIH